MPATSTVPMSLRALTGTGHQHEREVAEHGGGRVISTGRRRVSEASPARPPDEVPAAGHRGSYPAPMKPGDASRTAVLVCMERAAAHDAPWSSPRFSDPMALALLPEDARARVERLRSATAPRGLRDRVARACRLSIYRMGGIAEAYCVNAAKAGDVVDAPFQGASRSPLGDGCCNNSDCSSGRCWVKLDSRPFEVTPPGVDRGKCVCNDDGDCPGAQQCFKPFGKETYCSSTTKKLGESCKKNSQCASDKCERDECVCRKDTDCGSKGKCRTPITGKNYCE
jgi:hypothetical protein